MKPAALPHQETGSDFLAKRGFALLCDDAGLGKTFTTIMACDKVKARKILVVCPAVVRMHWADEFIRWQTIDRDVNVMEGFLTHPPLADEVTVVSHACLADVSASAKSKTKRETGKSLAMLKAGAPYDVIIVDESHQFSVWDAQRTRTLMAPAPEGLWSWGRHFWCLTGTPIVNSAGDLWPYLFGPLRSQETWWSFCNRFAEMKPSYAGLVPRGVKDAFGLAAVFRPHMIRRTIESVGIRLPSLAIEHVKLRVDPNALRLAMADLENWTPSRLRTALEEQDELRDSAIARVRHVLGMAKADAVAAHVEGLLKANAGPVVAFFQHTDVRERMFARLREAGRTVSWIDGKVTRPQLAAARDWHQAGRLDALLVQTQAGGIGLTLTRGCRVVVAELPWTSVALWQAIKRVHRIGQTKAVTAEVLRVDGCWLEDVLASVVAKKQKAAQEVLSLLTTGR